ncbi:hypothetical protein LEP1GSC036_3444 [Leptospira weilii str. 2006001853]|uniref:Uncharacterized protein n=1 Tax=Leptospira weilii str. 2006001853 TaxID=1001589 RepID=A0A828Z4Y4_9LEPT|nr:hypothetical protein LEP1GSC036_3444 [Leptospira weilii str. 2006001853]EMJ59557.1 hypothetical protein LEP1GSC051_4358 [Leptospira sp. P2653]
MSEFRQIYLRIQVKYLILDFLLIGFYKKHLRFYFEHLKFFSRKELL